MTTTVLWMRHGTCDDGLRRSGSHARPDSPLTICGTVEAEVTARYLRQRDRLLSLVVPSPLRRARQTASIVAGTLGAHLAEPLAAFAEWCAPYCVLGRNAVEYPPDYQEWRKQRSQEPDSSLPGGESLRAFAERAAEAMTAARSFANENGHVLVVSHRMLIGAVSALNRGYQHPAEIFSHARDFRLAPAQLWSLEQEEHR
ncbi:histidine phosphatase family protein [Haloactinomyces albus]|uniref:Phosphoglycerate mutase n=1 Tax=Haloactinomyces albus TaxID=1352928 RepID=A0AAE3ZEL0_9ACTN|nr:histidine phosphatase family protein [Haloactinomyces albus]MDR7303501.1 putative phosphoglycerate mutase [Haloactinomyces albus]